MSDSDELRESHIFRAYLADPAPELMDLQRILSNMPETPGREELIPEVLRVHGWFHVIEELNWQPLTRIDEDERAARRQKRRKAAEARYRLARSFVTDDLKEMRAAALDLVGELVHIWDDVRDYLYSPRSL